MKTRLFVIFPILALFGCATNPFTKFSEDHSAKMNFIESYSGKTVLKTTDDLARDSLELRRRGYAPFGHSSFQARNGVNVRDLQEQGEKIGADYVLYQSNYRGSEQALLPSIRFHPGQTSTTHSSGSVNTSNGAQATYSGASTTQTSGSTSTTMVPVTRHNYGHMASYWRKVKPQLFGASLGNLSPDQTTRLKRNTGAAVNLVINDSPAFRANVLSGDVIVAIDDTLVESAADFSGKLNDFAGKECKLTVIRDGQEIVIPVTMAAQSGPALVAQQR